MPVSDVMPTEPLTAVEGVKAILKLADSDDYDALTGTQARTLLKAIAKVAEKTLQDVETARGS